MEKHRSYRKILDKAEKYLNKKQNSGSSNPIDRNAAEAGGYRAYLNKAKELLRKKEEQKAGEDGKPVAADVDNEKYKKYMAVAAGILAKRMQKRRKRRRRKQREEEGEGEGEKEEEEEGEDEEDEEEDEDEDEDEESWLSAFMEQISEIFED